MKNILIVTFKRSGGGAESVINNLLNIKFTEKYKVNLLCKDDFISINNNLLNLLLFYIEIIRHSRSCSFVISGIEGAPFLLCFIALFTSFQSYKLLLWLHCEPSNYIKFTNLRNKIYINLSIYLANAIICASPVANFYLKNAGKKTLFLRNFINESILNINKTNIASHNYFPHFNLLFIGSLAELKQPIIPVLLFKYLKSKNYKVDKLQYFGDGPLRPKLVEISGPINFGRNVIIHGHVNNPWENVCNNSILLVPSLTEAMPMVVIEALSRGIPVLCNNFPGSNFFENNDGIFFIVNFADFYSLVRTIDKIITLSHKERNFRIVNSLNFIKTNFNNFNNFKQLAEFLDSM